MKEQFEQDPWLLSFVAFQFFASISALVYCAIFWGWRGVLLRYEPRRPVPWGILGALLAVAFTGLIILNGLAASESMSVAAEAPPTAPIQSLVASIFMQSLGPILLLILAVTTHATRSDVGLPTSSVVAWARDVVIGIVACLAALIPVGIVNIVARYFFDMSDEQTKHQLVEMLTETEPGMGVMVLATFVAVVVAPICEEITFRLLLQGWLEKWEDERIGWRVSSDLQAMPKESVDTTVDVASASAFTDADSIELTPADPDPPQGGVWGFPYGWTPIFLSSWLFAAADFVYGPEPIPLFVLALVLGYLYQRTHRIVPNIVAHGLFNLFSMITLWRLIILGEG